MYIYTYTHIYINTYIYIYIYKTSPDNVIIVSINIHVLHKLTEKYQVLFLSTEDWLVLCM